MSFFDLIFGGYKQSGRIGVIKPATEEKIRTDWSNIKILLKHKNPSQLRQALIVADRCLDNALRDVYAGTSLGDRLKNAKNLYDRNTYQKIWEAHKIRNNIVHESGFEPPYYIVIEAVSTLERALITLGVRL